MDVLQEQLIALVGTLITIVAGYATKQLKTFLDRKGATEKLKTYQESARIAVTAIEQIYQQENGPEKFEKAKHRMAQSLKNQNINITDEDLDFWIESAVKGMKKGNDE